MLPAASYIEVQHAHSPKMAWIAQGYPRAVDGIDLLPSQQQQHLDKLSFVTLPPSPDPSVVNEGVVVIPTASSPNNNNNAAFPSSNIMSSSQVFPSLTQASSPRSMPEATHGLASTEWYAPSTYAFHEPQIAPSYPSSTTVDQQPWSHFARASIPSMQTFEFQHPPPPQFQLQSSYPPQFKDPMRPRSSPSTFGPAAENLTWPTSNGLGIYSTAPVGQPTPVTSTFPPNVFQTYPPDDYYIKEEQYRSDDQQQQHPQQYGLSSPPEIRQPQPRRPYMNIAPNPVGVAAQKRKRDEEESQLDLGLNSKRRKRTSSVASAELSEDDRFLVHLKEEENIPWKDIVNRFKEEKGKQFQVAALQMRYKRLREKFRLWEDQDVNALKLAHEYWEKYKWEIISAKMLEYGIQERWGARLCAKKWQELEAQTVASTAGFTPAMTQYSMSPTDASAPAQHFAFMPIS